MNYLEEKMKMEVTKLKMENKQLSEKLAEISKQLAKSQKKNEELDHIIASLPGHVYWMDREGRILGCNDEQANDLGISSRLEMIGKSIYDFQPKELADKILINNNQILRSKRPFLIEESAISSDGSKKVFLSHKTPLQDKKGKIIGIVGIATDITKFKNAEFTLENIIAMMPGHVYWLDKNNAFLGCNDQQARTIGLATRNDIVGKTISDFQNKENTKKILAINNKVMNTGMPYTAEEKAFLADGTEGYYLSKKTPLYDRENKVIGLLGISIDITENKRMEEKLRTAKEKAEVANQAKSEFVLNMEHDLRTPASGIYGLSKILVDSVKEKSLKEQLQLISDSSEELLNLLNGILAFHEIESGNFLILDKKFNLIKLVDSIVKLESAAAKERNITLNYYFSKNAPEHIVSDKYRIHKILLNLIGNAIKFTNSGSINISVELAKQLDSRNLVLKLIVQDTGIGIPKEKLNLLYERFYKLDLSNTGRYQGLGLGLYIVKKFTTELNGEIEVISKVGKGTTFTCILPCKLPLLNE